MNELSSLNIEKLYNFIYQLLSFLFLNTIMTLW